MEEDEPVKRAVQTESSIDVKRYKVDDDVVFITETTLEERISAECVPFLILLSAVMHQNENNIAITSDIVENNDNDFDVESFPDLQSIEPPIDNDKDNGDSETNDEDTVILDDGYNGVDIWE
eukprot:Awhi_evm1s2222